MREAISGTTPPYFACSEAEEIILFERIFLPRSTAHAVLRFFTVYGPAGRPDMAYFGFMKMKLT